MTSLEDAWKGEPIHPEKTPFLHPKINPFVKRSLEFLTMTYLLTNLLFSYLPTRQYPKEGFSKEKIEQEIYGIYEGDTVSEIINKTTLLGRETAYLLHGEN